MRNLMFLSLISFSACATIVPTQEQKYAVPESMSETLKKHFDVTEAPLTSPVEAKISKTKKKQSKKKSTSPMAKKIDKPTDSREESFVIKNFSPMKYTGKALGVKAGRLEITGLGYKMINGKKVFHLRANAFSQGLVASLFKVNLAMDSFLDPYTLLPQRFQIYGVQGSEKKNYLELFDYEKKELIRFIETDGEKETKPAEDLQPNLRDVLSLFLFMRSIDYSKQPKVSFFVSTGKKTLAASLEKVEELKATYHDQSFPAWKVKLVLNDGKENDDNFMILLNTPERQVVEVQGKLKMGSFTLYLD